MSFEGKVVLVTGGASGMGRLAARRMARAGAKVVAADLDENGLRETARDQGGIETRVIDVVDSAAVQALVKDVEAQVGPIQRVYNAAAIMPTNLLLEQPLDEIHRIMQVNYGGVVNVSLATLPRMVERRRGELINFASIAGWVPNLHFGAYNASKFAVVAFTEVLYHENRGRGVRIACACPGPVDTPLLRQATSRPKILQTGPPPMDPARALDLIDQGVAEGRLFIFPGWTTAVGWRLRRFLPRLMWMIDHRAEGRSAPAPASSGSSRANAQR